MLPKLDFSVGVDLDSVATFVPLTWPEINPMISFGVLLAFGTLGGMLASRLRWLPTITGFMALGLLIGPSGLGLMPLSALEGARVLVDIALGLILFKLGGALHPWQLAHDRGLVVTSLVESLVTFASILGLMLWLGAQPVVCVIAAAIAVSSSPAVLIHVAEELRAKGDPPILYTSVAPASFSAASSPGLTVPSRPHGVQTTISGTPAAAAMATVMREVETSGAVPPGT